MGIDYPDFAEKVRVGHVYCEYIAQQFELRGLPSEVAPLRIRRSEAERQWMMKNPDKDIIVAGRWHVEVKSIRLRFTGPQDQPYEWMFVDERIGWDLKVPPPNAVVTVSQGTRGIAVVPVSTRNSWRTERKTDHTRGYESTFYSVHRSLMVSFDDLCHRMHQRLESQPER